MEDIFRITGLLARAEIFCHVTVISSSDKAVISGLKVIVFPDGSMEGKTGQQDLDDLICKQALRIFSERKKQTVELRSGILAFFDIISGEPRLVICGAGHIAVPLARFTREVGFSVTVIDDRPDFADPSRFPGCAVIAEDFIVALHRISVDRSTYVVVITRGHEHDAECLTAIISHDTAYLGLIGSRRRVRFVLEMLSHAGIPEQRLSEVFTPIGLPIGAESPEEIALSITSELVCVRRKGAGQARALRSAVLGES
jgi:xanthine dehydrogenase accessory factor